MTRKFTSIANGLTVKDIKRLIPDPVAVGKWLKLSLNGHEVEYKITCSNRYKKSYVHVRYFIPIYRDGNHHRNEYAYLRETKGGKWQEVS